VNAERSASKKKRKPQNLVRLALRKATNRPPRACAHALDVIAEHADHTTGHNSFAGTGTLMKRTRCGERQTREKLQRLRDGHWIDVQDGPDTESAKKSYAALYGDLHRLHRPAVYRVVLETLSAKAPVVHDGSFKGCTLCCPPSAQRCGIRTSQSENQRCGNGQFRGAETDTREVRPAADIPSLTSKASLSRLTASPEGEAVPEKQTPPSAKRGGSVSIETILAQDSAPGEDDDDLFTAPTVSELRRTVREALLILDQSGAAGTPYDYKAQAALTRLTEGGTCCLVCALIVPYWIAADDEALKTLNARKDLSHLWGDRHGYYQGLALGSFYFPLGDRGLDLFDRCEANIFKNTARSEEDLVSITAWCGTCGRRSETEQQRWRREARRQQMGLP